MQAHRPPSTRHEGLLFGIEAFVSGDAFCDEPDEPVREEDDEGGEEVVNDARDRLFFTFERSLKGFLREFFGLHKDAAVDGEFSEVIAERDERGITAAGADGRDADIPGFKFEPEGIGDASDVSFCCVISGDSRHGHPGAHRGHIHDEAVTALSHASSEEDGHICEGFGVEVEHFVSTPEVRVEEGIEDEKARDIGEEVDFEVILIAEIEAFGGGIGGREIDGQCKRLDIII